MRLIECYIENFGTLRDFHYSFDSGLNVLTRDNGFGKTTFSVFLKAMFYGLDDTKKIKLEENDRKHYTPWQGGVFGGWLTFTTGALSYKVERTFGAKASDDTYTLYELETGKVSHAYDDGLGEKIFGIDADGFERTVFLSERRLSQRSDNKSVSAKLSDLVGCDFDLGELDNALSMLEDRRKYYYKKGGSGKIGDIKAEISTVDAEISRISRIRDSIPEKERNLSELGSKINEKQQLLNEYSVRASRAKAELTYSAKKKELEDIEGCIESTLAFFGGSVPDESEVIHVEHQYSEVRQLRMDIGDIADDERRKEQLSVKIEKAEKIIDKFSKANEKRSPITAHAIFLSIGAMLALVGALLYFGMAMSIGMILLASGGVSLVIGFISFIIHKSRDSLNDALYSEAKYFLDSCGKGYVKKENYREEIYATKAELYTERALLFERTRNNAEKTARIDALTEACNAFLAKYKTEGSDPFFEIRKKISDYKQLTWKLGEARRDLASFIRINEIDPERIDPTSRDAKSILALDPDDIRASVMSLNREKALFEREYRDALDEVGRIDELFARKEELTEDLHASEDKYKIINLTREHLNKAKDRLTTKYLGKTREAFSEYVSLMSGEAPELFTLSVDFGITKSIGSVSKPEEAYSLGTRELYALAARLALNDSLYDVDKPFIILDDPFAHLDDKRYAASAKIIKRLAGARQIIYLTCSKSRAI